MISMNQADSAAPSQGLRQRMQRGILYLGFTVTGLACVLPGVLLPMLLRVWGWDDRHGGQLFLLIAGGSALGPLTVGRRPQRSVVAGFLLTAFAAAAWCRQGMPPEVSGVFWGVGLGMAMTGISLLSQDRRQGRAGALLRLNFLWALGAFACPLLAGSVLRASSFYGVLWGAAALLASLGLAILVAVPSAALRAAEDRSPSGLTAWRLAYWNPRGIPYGLFAATALATGIEASAGAWLATYADRSAHMLDITVAAPGCLWAGLLASRALSWLPQRLAERLALRRVPVRGLLVTVLLAALGLLLPFHSATLLVSSFVLGFGLGPLYPALLARVLQFRQTSLVFFAAGLASAIMPWTTGVLSTETGLLRIGLLVPALGAAIAILSVWQMLGTFEAEV